jgi:uncharacterized repeat protein (TIGR03847 family)
VSDSFDLRAPATFTALTEGPPGQRTFLLQAAEDDRVVTLKVEKQQVAALCEYLGGILADLPAAEDADALPADPVEPAIPAWAVGGLAVAYEQAEDRILLVAEELLVPDEDEEPDLLASPATARFHLTRGQVARFIEHGEQLVQAGRPTCPFCLQPADPAGHACPRLN